MDYEKIEGLLTEEAKKLEDVQWGQNWEEIATKFVALQNAYCTATHNKEDVVYPNTDENLIRLLPKKPLDAFMSGRIVANRYYCTDTWLSLDGYCNPVTAADTTLIDNFIFISDVTNWLVDLDTCEQEKLLSAFLEN